MSSQNPKRKKFLSNDVLEEAAKEVTEWAREENVEAALIGGFAMGIYGSPRLTGDLDFIASDDLPGVRKTGTLTFGGYRFMAENGTPIDWVLRDDDYRPLYEEALEHARTQKDGTRIIRPEYLAAMKLATHRPIDQEDLVFLLQQPRLVPLSKARDIVTRLVGGPFARDEFNRVVDEAKWRKATGRPPYGEG